MDYETSKIVYQLALPHRYIRDVAISPDGHIVGFQYSQGYDDVSLSQSLLICAYFRYCFY